MAGMTSGPAEQVGRMRRGALEYCALGLLRDGELGAFELVRALAGQSGLSDREGPVYPVLARMRLDGLVVSTWRDAEPGKPCRYYRITEEGAAALAEFERAWVEFRGRVDAILGTGRAGGRRRR
jgi:PadR family transcriptional regulator PadR